MYSCGELMEGSKVEFRLDVVDLGQNNLIRYEFFLNKLDYSPDSQ